MQALDRNEDAPGKFETDTSVRFKLRAHETSLSKEWELNRPLFLDITH